MPKTNQLFQSHVNRKGPIVEWTDNKSLMMGAFPDKFLFGQGIPNRLLTQQNWKQFSLYYDGRFDDPLFIAHGFNQLQHACCIRNSARIPSVHKG
jgi:hypothetical protein